MEVNGKFEIGDKNESWNWYKNIKEKIVGLCNYYFYLLALLLVYHLY